MHEVKYSCNGFRTCYLCICRTERPKVSKLLFEDFQLVIFVAGGYRFGAEKVEVTTIDETDKL